MHHHLERSGRAVALAAVTLLAAARTASGQSPVRRDSARADSTPSPATASATTIAPVDIPLPRANPLRLIAGRVPGALIEARSGRPGAAPGALLGGIRAVLPPGTSQPPVYVVDGVTIYAGMPAIDPLEIDHVDVVTGTAAAPRYGSRAANGLVRVTTRSGDAATRAVGIRFRSEAGTNDVERDLPTARQHALLMDTQGRFCVGDATAPLCARTVDWATESARINGVPGDSVATPVVFTFDPGAISSLTPLRQTFVSRLWPTPVHDALRQVSTAGTFVYSAVDVAGRAGGTAWLAGLSQVRDRGAFRLLDGATRYTARLNLDQHIGGQFALSLRGWYGHDRSDGFGQQDDGALFLALTQQPASADILARDSTGRLYARTNLLSRGLNYGNPLLYTTGNDITDALATERLLGGASLRWSPLAWLDLEASAGYDRRSDRWDYGVPVGFRAQSAYVPVRSGSVRLERWRDVTSSASLDATVRRSLGSDLATVWTVRVLSERHSATARNDWAYLTPGPAGQPPVTTISGYATADVSQRLTGIQGGASLVYRQRYVADLLLRRDAYTLGDRHPHAILARAALAWRASEERWWPRSGPVGALSLRASIGTAGSAPTYPLTAAQAFDSVQVDPNLRGPTTAERALGAELELFRRVGVSVTLTHTDTKDLVLPTAIAAFPPSAAMVLGNVGSLHGSSWELAIDVPVARTRDLSWSWRLAYDRSRATFGRLLPPPFMYGGSLGIQPGGSYLLAREGERYGTLYGSYFLRGTRDCARLPAPFSADCGTPGSSFQVNSDGWLVWVGKDASGRAFSPNDGLTRNLWTTTLPAASAPWGAALSWGMPIELHDTAGATQMVPLGSVVPSWHFSIAQDLRWRRLRVFALLEGVMGRQAWNLARKNALVALTDPAVDQRGADPAGAKPIGYYILGLGGAYLGGRPSNATVESASYAKLRELSVTYHVGAVAGAGDWEVALIGRNVLTLTRFHGLDPESGISGGPYSTTMLDLGQAATFPNLRTFSVALSTSF